MKKALYTIGMLIIASCGISENYTTDEGFIELAREYSPNGERLIFEYSYDTGAFGNSRRQIAILKESDLNKNLIEFNLPEKYKFGKLKWIDDTKVEAEVDIMNNYREGIKSTVDRIQIADVVLETKLYDIPIDGELVIEARKESPNGLIELVAYRYITKGNLNAIHISIIDKGMDIPRLGNYFIADMMSDYILNANWVTNDKIEVETNSLYEENVQYFFVNNRPNINYSIKVNDKKYESDYRWTSDETVRKTF